VTEEPVKERASRNPEATPLPNEEISAALEETASLLETQGANPFRVAAYRKAAETVRGLAQSVRGVLDSKGIGGLLELPGIGRSLARSIERLASTGRLGLLQRLRGASSNVRVLTTVPTIGPIIAGRLHDELGIETLEDLDAAARDGRLARHPGFGSKRLLAVREALAARFRTRVDDPPPPAREPNQEEPPVLELLDVDREYRERASRRDLPRIAPRRFNPTREAWLPILHTERSGRHYTALFSNTARAHELGSTDDWVVIYRDDRDGHGLWTVVTARYGRIRGRRIVRGRERECEEAWRQGTR
jgi:putative hydrolase